MSSHLRPVLSNTVAQLFAKFIGAGLTFVTTLIIIRLSGPALFGDLTKALALIAIGFTAIDFGLNAVTVRALGKSSAPRTLMAQVISLRLLFSVIAVLAVNLVVLTLPGGYTPAIKSVFWIGSLAIIFQGIYTSVNAWFQFQENYWRSALSSVFGTLCGTALTLYYAFSSPTLAHLLLATAVGYFAMAALSLFLSRGALTFTFSFSRLTPLLRESFALGVILILSILASKLDSVILGVFRPSAEVGEYGFSYRIFDVLLVFPVFIMNSLYPRLIKLSAPAALALVRRSLLPLAGLGAVLAALAWISAPAILLLRPELTLSVHTLRLLTPFLPLFFLTAPLMWYLVSLRRERALLQIYFFAALGNGLGNLLLVPSYGAGASALLTGATELFILLSLLYYFSHDQTSSAL